MTLAWIILFLGSWVRLLATAGLGLHRNALLPTSLALVPLLFIGLHHFLPGLVRVPSKPFLRWALAILTAVFSIAFARLTLLRFWDPTELLPTMFLVFSGLGLACFAGEEGPSDRGPGPWLWVALWMFLAARDPILGLVGAGLSPLLFHWGQPARVPQPWTKEAPVRAWILPLLLGLFLPRPWWDWGLLPIAALPLAAFGLGGALACFAPLAALQRRLPGWFILSALALTGLLYGPVWGLAWGGVMGLLAGTAFQRLPRPWPVGTLGAFWVLGLVISFALQANAWLPGLGHLVWMGN